MNFGMLEHELEGASIPEWQSLTDFGYLESHRKKVLFCFFFETKLRNFCCVEHSVTCKVRRGGVGDVGETGADAPASGPVARSC